MPALSLKSQYEKSQIPTILFSSALIRLASSPRHPLALLRKYSTMDLPESAPYISVTWSRPAIASR